MFKWFVSSFILLSILKNDVASAMPDKENRDQPEDLLVMASGSYRNGMPQTEAYEITFLESQFMRPASILAR